MLSLIRLFSLLFLLCFGLMVHAMPISSYEENMIETLRLKGLDEKEIELLVRPRISSPANDQHTFSGPVTTIDTHPLLPLPSSSSSTHRQSGSGSESESEAANILRVLWRLVPGHEWGTGEGMGSESLAGKEARQSSGGDEEEVIVVTGRMGKLKVSRA